MSDTGTYPDGVFYLGGGVAEQAMWEGGEGKRDGTVPTSSASGHRSVAGAGGEHGEAIGVKWELCCGARKVNTGLKGSEVSAGWGDVTQLR